MRLFVGLLFHIGQRGIVRNGRRIFLQQIPHNSHCLPRLFRRGPVFPDKRPLALAYLMQEGRRVKWISPVDLPDSAILFRGSVSKCSSVKAKNIRQRMP